jgi:hypothetical protein
MDTQYLEKLIRKYGRVTSIILACFIVYLLLQQKRQMNFGASMEVVDSTVVIRGSEHVTPSDGYWTSNQFNF